MRTGVLFCAVMSLAAGSAYAEDVIIPRGTVVFGELHERITSNPRRFRVGREVLGSVWKDVVVGGHTVITAGTPLVLRIADLDGSRAGGRGGSLEIMAVSVESTDGTEITLEGGYDKSGGDRYGLTRALSYVLWPAAFLPGRKAVLDEGTIFDASIPADTTVTVPDDAVPTLTLVEQADLTLEILYDEIDQRSGRLPLALTLCNRDFTRQADVTAVNDAPVRPILVSVFSSRSGNPCHEFQARINMEDLTKHFSPGINRFTVTMAGVQASVQLNVEM